MKILQTLYKQAPAVILNLQSSTRITEYGTAYGLVCAVSWPSDKAFYDAGLTLCVVSQVGNVSVPAVTAQTQGFSEICSQSSSSSSSSNQAAQRRQQDLQCGPVYPTLSRLYMHTIFRGMRPCSCDYAHPFERELVTLCHQ